MRSKLAASIISIVLIISFESGLVYPYTPLRSATVTGQGTKPVVVGTLLDDFSYAAPVNTWNCLTSTFSSDNPATATSICTASYTTIGAYSGYSLKLDYNVSKTNSYVGYVSNLGPSNISSYKTVSFWVKGSASGLFFKIEMKNTGSSGDTNQASVYIKDFLDAGVTTSWQQVTIPLDNFANISDWTTAKEFVITFENAQNVANSSPTSGALYIDDIIFGTTAPTVIRIDHFGDNIARCSLGGNMGNMPNDFPTVPWARMSFSATQYVTAANGLLSEYNVNPGWSGHWILIGGGASGGTAIPHNFSAYNNISFSVKARTTTENPKLFKIEIIDNGGTRSTVLSPYITTTWQSYRIPLSSFPGLLKTSIKQINIVYSDLSIDGAGGYRTGAIYIDKMQFD